METGTETEKQDASPSLTAASCKGPSDNGRSTLLSVCSFIIVTEFCERLAYYGLAGSLILLLEQQLEFTNADADNQFSGWTGACYLTPLIGGWLVDSFLGRYRAILSFCTIYLAGLALLVVGVLPSRMSQTLILAAIYLIALGTGGIKPSVSVFGAEQFDPKRERDRKELDSYFNWFYFSINLGALVSYTVVAYICQFGVRALGGERWRFALGFSIPLIAMTIAILVFISGTKRYKRLPPSGSVLTRAGHIIYQAINRHWWQRTLGQQEAASWLDQAKQRFGGSYSDPDVEGVKGVLRLVPFMLTMIPYWVVYNQMNTGFQNQGCQMDLSMGGRARIPVSTLNLFDTLAIIILIPVFDRIVYPTFKRRGRPLTMLQKIGWGFGFAVCSMVVAAVLEHHRKSSALEEHTYLWYHEQGRVEFMESHVSACKNVGDYSPFMYQQWWTERRGDPPAYCSAMCDLVVDGELSMSCILCQNVPLWSPVNVLWQIPQFVLIGISEILASVTGLEFFYSEAPAEMKSFTQALYLMTTALGSWLCIALVTLSNTNERAPWVPTDLNQGYMSNFFLLLALIMLLDLAIFSCISRGYQYKGKTESELEHHDVLADGGGGTMLTVPVAALEGFTRAKSTGYSDTEIVCDGYVESQFDVRCMALEITYVFRSCDFELVSMMAESMEPSRAVDELGWDVHLKGLKGFDLIDSPWPIVHGSRECLDNTKLETPDSSNLEMWVSQNVGMDKPGIRGTYSPQELMDALLGKTDALPGESGTGFSMADANPVSIITEKVSDAEQRLWTSGFKNVQVYRHRFGEPELELLARANHGGFDFRYHGTYSLVASVNGSAPAYMMAIREQIYRFTLKGNDATGFTLEQSVSSSQVSTETEEEGDTIASAVESSVLRDLSDRALPAPLTGVGPVGAEYAPGQGAAVEESSQDDGDDRNYIVGLSLTTDGTLIAATKGGNVTAYLLEPTKSQLQAVSYLPLGEHVKQKSIHISNSIAVHKQGIYIVTQEELVRVDLDPETKKLSFGWTATYGPSSPWYTSRLGPGSGSTPTITSCKGREYAVITDGSTQMGLAYYDIETGEDVARTKLDFGPAVNGTTSEQSVAVRGCQAFVVNNFIGVDGINDDSYCQYATGLAKQELATFCNMLQPQFIAKVCPAVFGCTAYGVAMYSLETNEDDSLELQKLWSRDDLTCGTSIPLISDPPSPGTPSTTYCVGHKRGSLRWGILALDTKTGDDVFTFEYFSERRMTSPALRGLSSGRDLELSERPQRSGLSNFFANPYYAGVEAVGGGSLAIGSIGGVIVVTPRDETVMTMTAAASSSSSSEIRSEVMGLLAGLLSVLLLMGGVFVLAVRVSRRRDWSPGSRGRIKSNGNEATYRLLSSPTR